jgi:hypothetical protein
MRSSAATDEYACAETDPLITFHITDLQHQRSSSGVLTIGFSQITQEAGFTARRCPVAPPKRGPGPAPRRAMRLDDSLVATAPCGVSGWFCWLGHRAAGRPDRHGLPRCRRVRVPRMSSSLPRRRAATEPSCIERARGAAAARTLGLSSQPAFSCCQRGCCRGDEGSRLE